MKIVLLDKDTLGKDVDLSVFEKYGIFVTYNFTKDSQTLQRVKEQDIVITNKVLITKEIMDNSSIKLICITATGTNNVDLAHAKKLNIPVKNVSGYSTNSVAQHTISLALQFIQNLDYYINYTKSGNWNKSEIFTNIDKPFFELSGKKWGIIGLGNIGTKVAQIATAFGCEVSYFSTSGQNNKSIYKQVDLKTILQQSDVISIHCPLNQNTNMLINDNNINKIKDKTIVINVARGGIIDEKAIINTINKRDIYFALDTVTIEPLSDNSVLNQELNNKKLILTPHIAWASKESRKLLIEKVEKNIKEFINGTTIS